MFSWIYYVHPPQSYEVLTYTPSKIKELVTEIIYVAVTWHDHTGREILRVSGMDKSFCNGKL